jgi:methyltransferase (TIGR00027 family)
MREGRASRTAEINALFRALEHALPAERRLFEDPLARVFLGWPLSLVGHLAALPGFREFAIWYIDRRWPGPRSSIAARTRLIDDWIGEALREPIEQFVILGAGFDSRAWRLAGLRELPVFEVDHPDTQAAKREALARARGGAPELVRFVASDFTRRDLEQSMAAAGYRESVRSFILWEGVTNYLSAAAVDATLAWCARAAAGSRLLFTYIHRDVLTRPSAFYGADRVFASLEKYGEQFRFGLDPAQLRDFLAQRGFRLERDAGAAEYRARYYGEAARAMRGHEFYRVALARVEAPSGPRDAAAGA